MSDDQTLEKLAELARREPAPRVEVAFAVMRRIECSRPSTDKPLAIITGLSAAAAAIVLYFAADAWLTWQDPITALLCSMDTVLQ